LIKSKVANYSLELNFLNQKSNDKKKILSKLGEEL